MGQKLVIDIELHEYLKDSMMNQCKVSPKQHKVKSMSAGLFKRKYLKIVGIYSNASILFREVQVIR